MTDGARQPKILAFGEHLWRNTRHIMGWDIKDDGFGVVLSPELPALMRDNLGPVVQDFLDRNSMTVDDIEGFLFHPGGRKVLETAEEVLHIDRSLLAHSMGRAARLRQHVVGHRLVRPAECACRRERPAGTSSPRSAPAFPPT